MLLLLLMSDDLTTVAVSQKASKQAFCLLYVGRFLSNFPIDRNHHFSSSSSPVRRRHRLLLQPNTVAEFAFTCSTDGSVDAVWFFVGWWWTYLIVIARQRIQLYCNKSTFVRLSISQSTFNSAARRSINRTANNTIHVSQSFIHWSLLWIIFSLNGSVGT